MITGDVGLYGERVAVVMGFITLASFIAMGLTCRSFVAFTNRIGLGKLTSSRPYLTFYRYHSYYWWLFWFMLLLHLVTGLMHTEIPKAGDPDAAIHWAILIMAISVLITMGLVFSSCRTFVSMFKALKGRDPLEGDYQKFYRLHSYLWAALLLALLGPLIASYIHIGFWPTVIE
jgi:hypothetical protein